MIRTLRALVALALVAASAEAGGRRPSALAHPDAALYGEAQSALASLKASARLQASRSEYERVVQRFRKLVSRYPQSGYCDDALLAIGDLYREMARRFKKPELKSDAEKAYRTLVAEYPSSRLGEPALFGVFEMATENGDKKRIADAAKSYLDAYPDGPRARAVKATTRKRAQPEPALPTPPPPGLAEVFNLRFWSGESSTRLVVDVEKEVPIKWSRLSSPDRLFIDLAGTRLHPNLKDRSFPVGDGLLSQVRVAQNRDSVVRVVLDFKEVKDQSVFYLRDPVRLVVDVRGKSDEASAPAAPISGTAGPAAAEAPASASADPAPDTIPPSAPRRITDLLAKDPRSSATNSRPAPRGSIEGPPAPLSRTPPAAVASPETNRAGSYSLARQLGLGARRIVIDPGHGGHDPGSIGPGGLQEKELTLDVALRVAKIVHERLGAEVIMTRATDAYVPLEERTAIANAKGADLFLSIHANSSRSPAARGIETYFLSFARDTHAEAVAARENAISEATLKDLQNLVKAIALNSKIDESRDFASSIQEAMIASLKPRYPAVLDRGVHTAPFYVLIGANMPSILAEISFLSHPQEERLLRSDDYRARIAAAIAEGVGRYLNGLNGTQTRALTAGGRRNKVAEREPNP